MKSIYAIIIIHFPEEVALRCLIEKITNYVDYIVIANNSASVKKINFSYERKVKLFNLQENVGIGEAQNMCMEWAFNNGAEYIINFDQDSLPQNDLIYKLVNSYEFLQKNGYKIGIVGPEYKDSQTHKTAVSKKYNEIANIDNKYFLVPQIIHSGSLMSKSTYEKVGKYDENLFIDFVDFEYCWKCKHNNLSIFLIKDLFIFHNLGEGSNKLLDKFNIHKMSPFRHYYTYRNSIHLYKKKYVPKDWMLRNALKQILFFFIYPALVGQIRLRYKYMVYGIIDGFKNKYGKYNK